MVRDDDIGGFEPIELVSQQEGAFVVCVIRYDNSLRLYRTEVVLQLISLYQLDALRGFGAGRRTHVKHTVVGLNVGQQRRHHRNQFLARDEARVFRIFKLGNRRGRLCVEMKGVMMIG